MKKEEQIMLICQVVQRQKRKKPTASELEVLANTKLICKALVESEDIEQEVLDETLSIIFVSEHERLRKKLETEIAAKEKTTKKATKEPSPRRTTSSPIYRSVDPCSGGSYLSSLGGRC